MASRSHFARRAGKRRRKANKSGFWKVFLTLVVICIAGVVLFQTKAFNVFTLGQSRPTTEQTELEVSTVEESTTETTTAEESATSDIVWEVQETPVQLPILMYHAIHDMAPQEEANANLIVSPATFESHLQALQEAGYYTVSPEEAYKILTENVLPQGKKVVWLTFDDGIWDFYAHAFPLLQTYQSKGTNNIITGWVGSDGVVTAEQIQEMKNAGMSFQSHTVSHVDLEYTETVSQTAELSDSKAYLDQLLGQDTLAIAYPSGRYSEETLSLSETSGYKLGVTTNEGIASAENGLLSLNRIRVLPEFTGEYLLQLISAE